MTSVKGVNNLMHAQSIHSIDVLKYNMPVTADDDGDDKTYWLANWK